MLMTNEMVADESPTRTPDMSVVIASFSGAGALVRCLESLEAQWKEAAGRGVAVEVIAATDVELAALAGLGERFETVRFVAMEKGTSVFRLRTVGVEKARGAVIAITEDHVTFSPGWLGAIVAAAKEHPIVGGPIENGLDGLYDWALFACEYVTFMPPQPDGPAGVLSGVNVAYQRELLELTREVWKQTLHENEVHDALVESRYGLFRVGDAVVSSHLIMPLRHGMEHLFTGARHYGRYRKARTVGVKKHLLIGAVILVPGILFWRILKAIMARRPGRLGTIVRGIGYIGCLIAAWTAGEAAGYLFAGPADDRQVVGAKGVVRGRSPHVGEKPTQGSVTKSVELVDDDLSEAP